MVKINFVLILVFLFSISYTFGADFVKIDDTVYVDKLESTPKTVKNIDNTDKLEFLVNKDSYVIDVAAIKPMAIELKLLETSESISVSINQESSFTLSDGTKLFVKYLEFETKEVKLSLWIEGDKVAKTEEKTSNEAITKTEKEESTTTETATEEKSTKIFTSKDYTNWIVIGSAIILIMVVGLIIYFNRKEGGLVS